MVVKHKLESVFDTEKIKRDDLIDKIKLLNRENDTLKNNLITAQNKVNAANSKSKSKYVE